MLLAAEVLSGDDAYRLGLVNRPGYLGNAVSWAEEIADLAPLTIAGHKVMLNRLEGRPRPTTRSLPRSRRPGRAPTSRRVSPPSASTARRCSAVSEQPGGRRPTALGRLTPAQRAELTGGADMWHAVAFPEAGVGRLKVSDGPAGARGERMTGTTSMSFPCATALAATWDRDLVRRVGVALGEETRTKSAHILLAPTVNLHRTPLAGRNFECFSEDPVLTAEMAVAYIEGVQSTGVGRLHQALRGQRAGNRAHDDQRRGRRAHVARDCRSCRSRRR